MKCLFFEYKLTLKAPLVVSYCSGNPNSVNTLSYIPGSSIRGALATAILRKNTDKQTKQKYLDNYILSDSVSFLPAYPEVLDVRGIPLPMSIKKDKHDESRYDNLFEYSWQIKNEYNDNSYESHDWPNTQLKNICGYYNLGGGLPRYFLPSALGRFHNQIDPNKGRAWNDGHETIGAIFSYESLVEKQVFRGIIKITQETEEAINEIINDIKELFSQLNNIISIGKSKNTGYGGNIVIDFVSENGCKREFNKYGGKIRIVNATIKNNDNFYLLLTSPYIGRDRITGSIDSYNIINDINELFNGKIDINNIKICSSSRTIGGFNKKWQSEIPQTDSLEAGTVIALKAITDINENEWLEIEQNGLGIRKNEGFGSFILLDSINLGLEKLETKYANRPNALITNLVRDIENRIVLKELEKEIYSKVAYDIRNIKTESIPPNHLLGRFRNLINSNLTDDKIINNLKIWLGDDDRSLKSQAKKHLYKCKINGKSLFVFLKDLVDNGEVFINNSNINLENYFFLEEDSRKSFDNFTMKNKNKIILKYLKTLIQMLSLKNRTNKERE